MTSRKVFLLTSFSLLMSSEQKLFAQTQAQAQAPAQGSSQIQGLQKEEEPLLKEYPGLKDFVFKEPSSQVYLGVGVNPLGFVKSKAAFSLSPLQIHYMSKRLDWEIFYTSFQWAFGGKAPERSLHFIMRSAPK